MNANDKACTSGISFKRYGRRLRIVGIVILLLGGAGAGWVYWLGAKSAALMNDPEMLGFNRAKHWQMGVMFGGMGNLMDDLAEDLKQPATQAILIVVVSVIIAAVCFLFARAQEAANNTDNDRDLPHG
jgi:hypothetical protein